MIKTANAINQLFNDAFKLRPIKGRTKRTPIKVTNHAVIFAIYKHLLSSKGQMIKEKGVYISCRSFNIGFESESLFF